MTAMPVPERPLGARHDATCFHVGCYFVTNRITSPHTSQTMCTYVRVCPERSKLSNRIKLKYNAIIYNCEIYKNRES